MVGRRGQWASADNGRAFHLGRGVDRLVALDAAPLGGQTAGPLPQDESPEERRGEELRDAVRPEAKFGEAAHRASDLQAGRQQDGPELFPRDAERQLLRARRRQDVLPLVREPQAWRPVLSDLAAQAGERLPAERLQFSQPQLQLAAMR